MPESPGPRRFAAASALVGAVNAFLQRGREGRDRRGAGEDAAGPPLEFDATLTLHGHVREAGLGDHRAARAVWAVQTAVRSMRGARMISVEYVGPSWAHGWAWMRRAEWVTLYQSWSAVRLEGPEWDRLRGSVEESQDGARRGRGPVAARLRVRLEPCFGAFAADSTRIPRSVADGVGTDAPKASAPVTADFHSAIAMHGCDRRTAWQTMVRQAVTAMAPSGPR